MKEYMIACMVEWLEAADERIVRIVYAYAKGIFRK